MPSTADTAPTTFQILHRCNGAVLFSVELDAEIAGKSYSVQLGFAVKKALSTGANFTGADFTDADLTGADLTRADLTRADFTGADFTGADFTGANFTGANLTRANFTGANLTRADFTGADFTRANFTGANLTRADFTGADFAGANLTRANFTRANFTGADFAGANLTRADLTRANFTGADFTDADLTRADLTRADLTQIRDDLWAVLSAAPLEVDGLRMALAKGRVDGSTYTGDCACLVGTIANVRNKHYESLGALQPNSSRPIERFFMGIRRGDTPETNQICRLALGWCDEWLANMRAAFGPKEAQP